MTLARALIVPAALAVALALAACGPATPAPVATPTSESPSPTPTETATGPDLPEDAVLYVEAIVEADNGARLNLTQIVHSSSAWDDPTHSDRPDLMTSVCEGLLDDTVYADGAWSFTKVDITAKLLDGPAWPADEAIEYDHWIAVGPFANDYLVAASGVLLDDPADDPDTPHCASDKWIARPGTGTLVIGLPGDADSGAGPALTRWSEQMYGFIAKLVEGQTPEDTGMTVKACEVQATELGKSLSIDPDWQMTSDDTRCWADALS